MNTIFSILSICFLSLVTITVQALPLINVTNERLSMKAEVVLEYPDGDLKLYRDTYSGSLFSGEHVVDAYNETNYLPFPGEPGYYYELDIEMNAWFDVDVQQASTRFWMFNETDVYDVGDTRFPDPEKIIASVIHIKSITTLFLDFYVTGGDAQFGYGIHNEGTFAPVSVYLRDMSTSTMVIGYAAAYGSRSEEVSLLDGHRYVMSYKVSDQGWDDDDIYSSVKLLNANIVWVSAAEPVTLPLLLGGLIGLWIIRGGSGADRDRPYCS